MGDFNDAIVVETNHRPWPMPQNAWVMTQTWNDLLFAHGRLMHLRSERYCLYAVDRRARPYRLDVHHPPWPLEAADAEIAANSMASSAGIELPSTAPLLHFAKRQDAVAWPPERI
ncbi:MAG TPA: DUF2071 domain-containing protein [Vicinamibacterales bacterium]|jgi:uncharacterized protein YqjF (DUF2071 family)